MTYKSWSTTTITALLNVLIIISFNCATCENSSFTPIVLWHGMGDSCCFSFSLGAFQKRLKEALPDVYVVSLMIGNNVFEDVENGYRMHPDKQIKMACDIIRSDSILAEGFNAIGFSQGGQFLRALQQRCPSANIKTLISLGGQHQGVYGLPNCASVSHQTCDYLRRLLNHAAYLEWVQKALVQATYWHNPLNEETYRQRSTFLADINNELALNLSYIQKLQSLNNFVMLKFGNDTMVQPIESQWFGFYKPGQSMDIESLQDSSLFIDDRLGLQKLGNEGKLHFLAVPGNHLKFKWTWFVENIIKKFLK